MLQFGSADLRIVVSETGAEIRSVRDSSGREFMWQGLKPFWKRTSPVLFPIVGRLRNDRYLYQGKEFRLSQHGFARDMDFTVTHSSADRASLLLRHSAETLQCYPFPFELGIHYRVQGRDLYIQYEVRNTGSESMPFNLGAHPGFNTGPHARLEFPGEKVLEVQRLKEGLRHSTEFIALDDGFLEINDALFAQDAMILCKLQTKRLKLIPEDGPEICLNRGNMPFLGIWKQPGAPFICLEPWNGMSDHEKDNSNLIHKEFIDIIGPQEAKILNFSLSFCGDNYVH